MYISLLENMLIGMWLLQTLSSFVGAMNKPQKPRGAYLYWYKVLHSITNNLDMWFEQKFGVTMPQVVDETAVNPNVPTSTHTQYP